MHAGKPARLIVHGELATVEPEDLDLENLYTSRAVAYDVFELYDGDFDRERDEEPAR